MKFAETPIPGVFEVFAEVHRDERGHFARLYCPEEFRAAGIDFHPTQVNVSFNRRLHTLRGLHYQSPPHAEAKLVRAIAGHVWDVAIDLRPGAGQGRWHAIELDAGKMNAIFLPEGVAHGFMTLSENAELLYQMGRNHVPGEGKGMRWDDPDLGIEWPAEPSTISEADLALPRFAEAVLQ